MVEELEIKLSLAQPDLDAALAWLLCQPGARQSDTLQLGNIYYDTPDGELNRKRIALRIRKAGADYIQTLKARGEFVGGAHRRQEWEWPLSGPSLDLGLIDDLDVGKGLNLDQLEPVFETNFERRIALIEQGDTLIEVALDSGHVFADGRTLPLCEVEFELKKGDSTGLLRWARSLAREVPIFLNLVSKAEQGYYLAGRYAPAPAFAVDSPITAQDFLVQLSLAWLEDDACPISANRLQPLRALAAESGLGESFDALAIELAEGVRVRTLMAQKSLGQIQLAIAGVEGF